MSHSTVTMTPTDRGKTGLTLRELAEFVSTSYALGAGDEDSVRVIAGISSQIKKIWTDPTQKDTP